MDALIANSTYTYDAMNDGITISGPGWGSLLTGVWPDKHGILDNGFAGGNLTQYPHLFKRIEDHDPNLHTVSICQWHPVNNNIATGVVDTLINVSNNSDHVGTAAVDYLTNEDPDAIFLHFDDVDHAGHASGFTPSNPFYLSAIEDVDYNIGLIMTALNNRPNIANEDWIVIISTDHGGINFSHGGTTFEERNIFLIVSGDDVPNQQIHADSMLVMSNCLQDSVQLYFDGDASVNTTLNSAFNFGATQDFTIECRVRTTNSGDVAIVTDKDWDSGLFDGWVFSFNIGGGPWKVNVGDGQDRVDVEGNMIDDDVWHTLSATFDRDGMLTIYEDGVQVNQGSMADIDDIYSGNPISMGMDSDGEYAFTGSISEVRIFNGLVDPNTINSWRCTVLDNSHPNYGDLLGYWRLTEGAGAATVTDESTTEANGILNGAAWQEADNSSVWVQDFTTTPKQVDFAVSALEHLCIPLDTAWNLDGLPFGVTNPCLVTDIEKLSNEDGLLEVYPNPIRDRVGLRWYNMYDGSGLLRITNTLGEALVERRVGANGSMTIDLEGYAAGVYWASVMNGKGQGKQLKFVKVLE